MLDISIQSNISEISKKLNDLAYRQIPFVEARTVTELAKLAQRAEKQEMPKVFDKPTPFTVNSVRVQGAKKGAPIARVYVGDIAAKYLEPFEDGGEHTLIGKGVTWLNPKNKSLLNAYGNFGRSKLQSLLARPDVYVGKIKGKDGKEIGGVWQRSTSGYAANKRGKLRRDKFANTTGRIKLLIRFGDAMPVRQRLGFGDTARTVVAANVNKVFGRELAKALAMAKL